MSGTEAPSKEVERPIWPKLEAKKPVYCAALFIDIRNSTEMSRDRLEESTTVAMRTQQFLSTIRMLWQGYKAPEPIAVRSYGDGLFCVWELNRLNRKRDTDIRARVLDATLKLHDELTERLTEKWGRAAGLGMGLAAGDASVALLGNGDSQIRDYYGYVINLAAKLQSFARPYGVVIEKSFVRDLGGKGSTRHEDVLSSRKFWISNAEVPCLTTSKVHHDLEWRCLAWPGFATAPMGLNANGIDVLTHEGLQGKIGSLSFWKKNDQSVEGRPFEIIIDDFDGLTGMSKAAAVDLLARGYSDGNSSVSLAIRSVATAGDGFFFRPIRCGLNALAWNNEEIPYPEVFDTYGAVLQAAATGEGVGGNKSISLGLYDNLGASFPILLTALNPTSRNIFDLGEQPCDHLVKALRERQNELQKATGDNDRKLFYLHRTIEGLAHTLQTRKDINMVLGGGAWLANPMKTQDLIVSCGVPAGEKWNKGFLWIEGAAILNRSASAAKLIQTFLEESVLAPTYQRSLPFGTPYGASPVASTIVSEILSENFDLSEDASAAIPLILAETKTIFGRNGERLNEGISLRQQPKHAANWIAAWEAIKKEFCVIV